MEIWPNPNEKNDVENMEGNGDLFGREGEAMVSALESHKDGHPDLLAKAKRFATLALFATGLTFGGREAEAGEVAAPAPAVGARTLEMKQKLENLGFEVVKGGEATTATAPKTTEQPQIVYVETKPQIETKKAEKSVDPVKTAEQKVKTADQTIRSAQRTIDRLSKMTERIAKIGQ